MAPSMTSGGFNEKSIHDTKDGMRADHTRGLRSLRSGLATRPDRRGLAKRWASAAAAVLALSGAAPVSAQAPALQSGPPAAVQLYTLDCGLTEFKDAAFFSDTGEYDGKSVALPTPCFLIHHGKDWMLWDTGNGDQLAALPNGVEKFGGRFSQKRTLASQLAELGLKPADIRFVALSHLHQDHAGNIGLFPKATFLIAGKEIAFARSKPTPFGIDPDTVGLLSRIHIDPVDEDRDVFGDGSVRILKAPGHTPGERMLLVKLAHSGPILISGDVVHTRENYEKNLVPAPNVNRADSLASLKRLEEIAANTKARVVIQHSPEDFASMPVFPKSLD